MTAGGRHIPECDTIEQIVHIGTLGIGVRYNCDKIKQRNRKPGGAEAEQKAGGTDDGSQAARRGGQGRGVRMQAIESTGDP